MEPFARLRQQWFFIFEAVVAASVAWIIDTRLVGHHLPFFAPAAAIIVLGQARGQRNRRVIEVLVGVACGVFVGDLFVRLLGPGETETVFAVIFVTLVVLVAFGASTISIVQGSVSALYLVVIPPPTLSAVPYRFVDALIGGGVALLVSQLSVLRKPLTPLLSEIRGLFGELTDILNSLSDALTAGDEQLARDILGRARNADSAVAKLRTASSASGEALLFHIHRRRNMTSVQNIDTVTPQIDYFVRNLRVLARSSVTLLRQSQQPWPQLAVSLRTMSLAVDKACAVLHSELNGLSDAQSLSDQANELALTAVAQAGEVLRSTDRLPAVMVAGQLRATAVDLLRLIDRDDRQVLADVEAALGLPKMDPDE